MSIIDTQYPDAVLGEFPDSPGLPGSSSSPSLTNIDFTVAAPATFDIEHPRSKLGHVGRETLHLEVIATNNSNNSTISAALFPDVSVAIVNGYAEIDDYQPAAWFTATDDGADRYFIEILIGTGTDIDLARGYYNVTAIIGYSPEETELDFGTIERL